MYAMCMSGGRCVEGEADAVGRWVVRGGLSTSVFCLLGCARLILFREAHSTYVGFVPYAQYASVRRWSRATMPSPSRAIVVSSIGGGVSRLLLFGEEEANRAELGAQIARDLKGAVGPFGELHKAINPQSL